MQKPQYRVESSHPIVCHLIAHPQDGLVFSDRSLAVVFAAKSRTQPQGQEIRVVNTLSGEIIYRKSED